MDVKLKKICKRVKEYTLQLYGDKIKQMILYGSQTKGSATNESDVDLLIVVEESLDPFDVRERLSDLLWDILMEESELISVVVLPENNFSDHQSAFIINVKKEGIHI